MKPRPPQLRLQLDAAAPAADASWRDGLAISYMGGRVFLHLGTACADATLEGDTLHLPLPPGASSQQIRDAAETWLRAQAVAVIEAAVDIVSRSLERQSPRVSMSFAARGNWWQADAKGGIRFHWRLIEQPEAVIVQVVRQAVANLKDQVPEPDLFSLAA